MNSLKRRKLLTALGRSAMAGIALLLVRTGRAHARPGDKADASIPFPSQGDASSARGAAEDPLLAQAVGLIDRLRGRGTTVLAYPVSRLQREFSLGYSRACALADQLAQRGEWTIGYSDDGVRYARIHRMEQDGRHG